VQPIPILSGLTLNQRQVDLVLRRTLDPEETANEAEILAAHSACVRLADHAVEAEVAARTNPAALGSPPGEIIVQGGRPRALFSFGRRSLLHGQRFADDVRKHRCHEICLALFIAFRYQVLGVDKHLALGRVDGQFGPVLVAGDHPIQGRQVAPGEWPVAVLGGYGKFGRFAPYAPLSSSTTRFLSDRVARLEGVQCLESRVYVESGAVVARPAPIFLLAGNQPGERSLDQGVSGGQPGDLQSADHPGQVIGR
jgi:hypothetical protein